MGGLTGLKPRNFTWVIKGKLAISERPGGAGRSHRRVRRDEELIWISESEITHVLSLLPSSHNLKAYEEFDIAHTNIEVTSIDLLPERRREIYRFIDAARSHPGEVLLVHMDDFQDPLIGLLAGYLLHASLVDGAPTAVALMEQIVKRPIGPEGRQLVG